MANIIKNLTGVTKEVLYQLTNEMSVMKGIKRQYSEQFAKDGAKIGNVLNVKSIKNVPVTRGPVFVGQSLEEKTIPIEILPIHQYQTGLTFGSAEYALSVESFTEKTNLKQIIAKMANEIEQDILEKNKQVYNMVGTLGTSPGTAGGTGLTKTTAPNIFTNASAVLTAMGAPSEQRTMALTPEAMGDCVGALAGLLNPTNEISAQYRKGRIAQALNYDFVENVNIPSITTGTRTAGTVLVGSTDGDTTIHVTGLGANATISAGEHITIAGVRAVNPMNQQPRSFLQMFVVLADAVASAGGVATLSVSPQISLSNPETVVDGVLTRRYPLLPINVNGTVNALPLAGAAVTFSGAASSTGVLNVAHHRDSVALTSVDLPLYGGADKCVRMQHEGISLRVWQEGDIRGDQMITRIDVIAVSTLVRPELSCIVWG